jgi:drug/metabolite transporter (DMT)-like permease
VSLSTAARPRADRLGLALLIVMGAYACFTMIDSSAKWLGAAGLPALQIVFIRYAGNFIASLAIFVPLEGPAVFRSNAPGKQVLRAVFLLTSTMMNFIALKYLPLTVTTAIFFATPMVVPLLAIPVLGERIGLRRFLAICAGFGGVLIITQPWGASFHWAMLCSLGALLSVSSYLVMTRAIAGVDNNPTGQLMTSAIPTMLIAPFALWHWVWPATPFDWAVAIAIGCFATLGHSLLTVGYRYAEASTLAPVVYIQIIYVTIISWAVFSEPPDLQTIAGTGVIVLAGLYIWLRERQLRKRPPTPLGGRRGNM